MSRREGCADSMSTSSSPTIRALGLALKWVAHRRQPYSPNAPLPAGHRDGRAAGSPSKAEPGRAPTRYVTVLSRRGESRGESQRREANDRRKEETSAEVEISVDQAEFRLAIEPGRRHADEQEARGHGESAIQDRGAGGVRG